MVRVKTCSKCKAEKTVDQFNRNRSRRDGLQHYCRDCKRRIDLARYHRIRAQMDASTEAAVKYVWERRKKRRVD